MCGLVALGPHAEALKARFCEVVHARQTGVAAWRTKRCMFENCGCNAHDQRFYIVLQHAASHGTSHILSVRLVVSGYVYLQKASGVITGGMQSLVSDVCPNLVLPSQKHGQHTCMHVITYLLLYRSIHRVGKPLKVFSPY